MSEMVLFTSPKLSYSTQTSHREYADGIHVNGTKDSLKGVRVCHFEELQLKHNGIHVKGVLCLADAICSQKVVIEGELCLSDNFLGLEGTLAVGKILSCNHCQLSQLDLSGCMLTTARGGPANMDPLDVRDVGQQLCHVPRNKTIIRLVLNGSSFSGNSIDVLVAFMYLCKGLKCLHTSNCEISSDDLIQLFSTLSSLKPSFPNLCSKLETWHLNDNGISDSGVSALIEHLPSLFPKLGCGDKGDVHLYNNTSISSDMKKKLKEELRSRKVRCCVEQF